MTQEYIWEATNTNEKILLSCYRALQKQGYSNVTIDDISEEFEKSMSLIYHYYTDKDTLILSTIKQLIQSYCTSRVDTSNENPQQQLEEYIKTALLIGMADDDVKMLMQLRAQAAYNNEYQVLFNRYETQCREQLRSIISDGVKKGQFESCDRELVVETLITIISGVLVQQATQDNSDWRQQKYNHVCRYIEDNLYI